MAREIRAQIREETGLTASAGIAPNKLIAKIASDWNKPDGQFEVVWKTDGLVPGDAWSDFLPASKDVISDWTAPIKCGNYNTKTKKCSGQNY